MSIMTWLYIHIKKQLNRDGHIYADMERSPR